MRLLQKKVYLFIAKWKLANEPQKSNGSVRGDTALLIFRPSRRTKKEEQQVQVEELLSRRRRRRSSREEEAEEKKRTINFRSFKIVQFNRRSGPLGHYPKKELNCNFKCNFVVKMATYYLELERRHLERLERDARGPVLICGVLGTHYLLF